jgi:hypothetical protein
LKAVATVFIARAGGRIPWVPRPVLHSRYQQIAMLEIESGEVVSRRLEHENGEAKAFYASLPKPSLKVCGLWRSRNQKPPAAKTG